MFKKLALLSFAIFIFDGCKKYPEDDLWFHLRKPSERLTCYKWRVESYRRLHTGTYPVSCTIGEGGPVFRKDGTCGGGCRTANGPSGLVRSYLYDFEGTWQLTNSDETIRVSNDASHFTNWTILQLDRKELKIISDSIEFICVADGKP